jgi:single-stranded DNA-binding protein
MIDALVAGKLYGQPKGKTAKNGNQFATAKVRAAAGDGESLFVNVIAFSQTAVTALLALEDGDSVALAGELTPRVWTDRDGNAKPAADLVAQVVLSTYHVGRKRKAVLLEPKPREPQSAQPGGDPWEEVF